MFALFWQKKNARLAARLDTVIETSERARKEFRPPPPRVTIDTSFLDQSAARAEDGVEAPQDEPAAALAHEVMGERDSHHEVEAPSDEARWSVAEAKDALAALREAAQHLERAEIRANQAQELETAAHLEAEASREQSARREAEVQRALEARQELAAAREAAEQRAAAARRQAEELRERSARHATVVDSAEDAQSALAALQHDADQRESALRDEAEGLRDLATRLRRKPPASNRPDTRPRPSATRRSRNWQACAR